MARVGSGTRDRYAGGRQWNRPARRRGFAWVWRLVLAVGAVNSVALAEESETLADQQLRQLAQRQRDLLATAAPDNPYFDEENFRQQIERLCRSYEGFLRQNPQSAAGFATYGYLLGKVGQGREGAAMLLKANQLDPNLPLVKNQLGNYLAEEGRPLDAASYFMEAVKLAPEEPLYHYQLGTLLYEARDDFLKSGEWQREAIDRAIHEAFKKAAELAPDRIEFTYRHAESFYHLDPPDWDAALKAWGALEEKAPTAVERETMRLHAANVLILQGKPDHARALLATIREEALQKQKEKLVARLAETTEK